MKHRSQNLARRLSILMLMAVACVSGAHKANAHPHVFIDSSTEILINADHVITGVRHRWLFDEQYTAFALVGMDVNKDGIYSKEELDPLAKENLSSLHEFDYFTFAHQEKKPLKFKGPEDAALTYENNELVLTFTLPLETPVKALGNPVKLGIYDPEFFIAFLEPKNKKPVYLVNSAPKSCMFEMRRASMDQTGLVESRLGQAPDLTNEENKGAGSLFAPSFYISCLSK